MNSLNKAVQSDKARQVFFSNISHEMRTPLNAVINLTKVAKTVVQDPQKSADYLAKIEKSSLHLLQLVNDILEMSRLAQGKVELKLQRLDLRECLEECFSPFKIQAD
uniref:sensor histidine kinase n=1 Tax=uncultured Mailhella sp. TaxID=1981031 RepID=UPI0025D111E8